MGLLQNDNSFLLGENFSNIGVIPFDLLPQKEQSERIRNYIRKNTDDKKTKKELEKECIAEYTAVRSKETSKYEIDANLLNGKHLEKGIKSELTKDAAALCQLTYACDPNRMGDNIYHTSSKNWFPYKPTASDYLSKRMQGMFSVFTNINYTIFDSDLTNYTLKEKWGFGTFKSILTKNLNIFDEFDKRLSRTRTGFFSMLYYRKIDVQVELAYVTAGTTFNWRDQKWDVILDNGLVNVGQAVTGLSPQHTLSIQNAKILKKICDVKNWKLYFFGHSLGGGLAVANGLATGCETIAFNNAGLNRIRNWTHNSYRKDRNNIKCFFTEKDFLSTENENKSNRVLKGLWKVITPQNIGERIYLGTGGHGIEGVCQEFNLDFISHKQQIKEGI